MDLFEGISLHNVAVLLQLLQNSSLTEKAIIKRRYEDYARAFELTSHFLVEIGAIAERDDGSLATTLDSLDLTNENEIVKCVVNLLLVRRSKYRNEVITYLRSFEQTQGAIVYCPPPEARGASSAVRNFLMELRVIGYDNRDARYTLSSDYYDFFVTFSVSSSILSPRRLRRIVQEQQAIGLAAELAVIEFEKERVGTSYADRVEHIALESASAGFDIKSVTPGDASALPRLIEVKGVSEQDYEFFWTANEIAVARKLPEWYYLYLLPIDRYGRCMLHRLEIVENPYEAVLINDGEWLREEQAVRCAKKESCMHVLVEDPK